MSDGDGIKTYVSGSRDSSITLVLALALLAVVAGAVGATTGAGVGYLMHSPYVFRFAVAGFAIAQLFAFVFSFFKAFHLIEVWLGFDLNKDGYVGEPTYPPILPEPEYRTPVWVEHDPREGQGATLAAEIPTPKDDTIERMAVILSIQGWEYFTQDHFVNSKWGTKLMTRQQWDEKFFPNMQRAGLAQYRNGVSGPVYLTERGKAFFKKVAGRAGDQIPAQVDTSKPLYALDIERPFPTGAVVGKSSPRKLRG